VRQNGILSCKGVRNKDNRLDNSGIKLLMGGDMTSLKWRGIVKDAGERNRKEEIFPVNCLKASHHGT